LNRTTNRWWRRRDDEGLTLIDVIVSMSIMSVVMGLFTTGIVQMYRMSNGTDAKSVAQSQVSLALLRLDKEIRYASGISPQYLLSGNQYVDFLLVQKGVPTCVQLRVAAGQLEQRTWTYRATPFAPSAWIQLASGITSTTPFTFADADDTVSYQRLTVKLTASSGAGNSKSSKTSTVTYTALNTTTKSLTNDCIAGRSGV
jgi:Tfp pilus assembly protein PilV